MSKVYLDGMHGLIRVRSMSISIIESLWVLFHIRSFRKTDVVYECRGPVPFVVKLVRTTNYMRRSHDRPPLELCTCGLLFAEASEKPGLGTLHGSLMPC
jgi:hypothetical protein